MVDAVIADLVILAIDTLHDTMGKKNIANTLLTADGRFLTPVDTDGCNIKIAATATVAIPAVYSVSVAITRTQCAIFQYFQRTGQGIEIQDRGVFFRYFWQFKCKTTDK
jgi:hypothetical protein